MNNPRSIILVSRTGSISRRKRSLNLGRVTELNSCSAVYQRNCGNLERRNNDGNVRGTAHQPQTFTVRRVLEPCVRRSGRCAVPTDARFVDWFNPTTQTFFSIYSNTVVMRNSNFKNFSCGHF